MSAQSRTTSFSKVLTGLALGVGAGVAAVSAYAKANSFRGPLFLARYLSTPHSQVWRLFPSRPVRRADNPREFPQDLQPHSRIVPWKGEYRGLTWVLEQTNTNAFLVAKDGVLVNSWCREGVSLDSLQSSWSIAKSVVGLVAGQLINEGKLSEDTRLTEILPEFQTGGPFGTITVGQLLDMRSGIDLPEEYKEWKPYTGVGGMLTSVDLPGYLMRNRNTFAVPGTVSDYRSVDTQYLSMIITRVEGAPLADIVQRRIWGHIGALDTANWSLDDEGGIEKGFMALNASPRDFLKIGQLMLDRGKAGDTQVIDESWLDRIGTPVGYIETDTHTWGYAATWWHPSGSDVHGDFTALGVYGQYVYVNPAKGTVIVKLSDHGTEQDEDETIEVFRAIADRL